VVWSERLLGRVLDGRHALLGALDALGHLLDVSLDLGDLLGEDANLLGHLRHLVLEHLDLLDQLHLELVEIRLDRRLELVEPGLHLLRGDPADPGGGGGRRSG